MPIGPPQPDPALLVQSFRSNYMVISRAIAQPEAGLAAEEQVAEIATPYRRPIDEAAMPDAVRALLDAYRAEHGGVKVSWEKHLRTENGEPVLVVEDERELPGDREFISVSATATLTTADTVRIVTDLYVGRLARR